MGVEFDSSEDFKDICDELDPEATGRIQFANLIRSLEEDEDEENERLFSDLDLNEDAKNDQEEQETRMSKLSKEAMPKE